jgi:hypothetical protein
MEISFLNAQCWIQPGFDGASNGHQPFAKSAKATVLSRSSGILGAFRIKERVHCVYRLKHEVSSAHRALHLALAHFQFGEWYINVAKGTARLDFQDRRVLQSVDTKVLVLLVVVALADFLGQPALARQ